LLHARSGTATPLALNIPEGVYLLSRRAKFSPRRALEVSKDVVEPAAHVAARKALV